MAPANKCEEKIDCEEAVKLAHEARALAHESKARIDGHEQLCALRYQTIGDSYTDIKDSLKAIHVRLWIAAGSTIGVLLTALFFVIGFIKH